MACSPKPIKKHTPQTLFHPITIEILHDHVMAAMLDGRNNEMFLHENEFNSSGERDYIVLPSKMAAFT
jgi:hypothetical protein